MGRNKAGDTRGTKEINPHNFANNPELASRAGKKQNTNKLAGTQAITKSPVIVSGKHKRITPEVQQMIRDELTKDDYIHKFIKSFLKEAKEDPSSKAGQLLASAMFNEKLLETLDQEINKQMNKDAEFITYRIRQTLYDKQQEVFDNVIDNSILIICTRRAGKTELNARLLLRKMLEKPEIPCLYINRSFDSAVSQLGKPLVDLLEKLSIKYEGSPGGGLITLENGSSLRFGGFNNKGQIDQYRGYKFAMVIIDEISHLRNPKMLLDECIEPAMLDYGKEAQIIYTGTPPRIKANYAYQLWHTNIRKYHWSFMDNPFIPDKENAIQRICEKHGLTEDAPFIQREYFGNMEAFDEDAMIFRGYQMYDKVPEGTATHAWIGVDWGYEDKAAVVGTVEINKVLYVVYCWSESQKSISEISNKILEAKEYIKNHFTLSREVAIITDTNEKSATYELYSTYKLKNVFCAYKYDRDVALDQLAEWCRTGIISISKEETELKKDFDNSVWERDELTDEIKHEISEDYHPNAAMALLYLSRQFAYDVLGQTDTNKSAKDILEGRKNV